MTAATSLLDDLATQPGVSPERVREVLGGGPWITVIAEHHLGQPEPGVDLMACTLTPWHADVPPSARLDAGWSAHAPLLAWFEWDLVARGRARPLMSLSAQPDFLLDGRKLPDPEDSLSRWRPVLASLSSERDAVASLELVVGLGGVGHLLHAAPLSPRGREGLRLSTWVRASRLPGWLDGSGFLGSAPALRETLFKLVPPEAPLGVQVEVVDGRMGAYLGLESPLIWQGRRAPTMDLSRWLPGLGTAGRARWEALRGWVDEPPSDGHRRQLYLKLTAGAGGWTGKAYAGVSVVHPGAPSSVTRLLGR